MRVHVSQRSLKADPPRVRPDGAPHPAPEDAAQVRGVKARYGRNVEQRKRSARRIVEIRYGPPNARVGCLASHLAPGVSRPMQQPRGGFLHEQRLTAVPPGLQCQPDTVVKQEISIGVGEAERIELRVPDLVQLEVQDVSAARAEVVRMDFAGWMKSDLQRPAMDRSGADLLEVVALDHDREVRVAVLMCRQ
jgi:hypothetical protein